MNICSNCCAGWVLGIFWRWNYFAWNLGSLSGYSSWIEQFREKIMFKSLLEYEIVEQKILLRSGKRHSHVKWNEYLFKSFFVASHTNRNCHYSAQTFALDQSRLAKRQWTNKLSMPDSIERCLLWYWTVYLVVKRVDFVVSKYSSKWTNWMKLSFTIILSNGNHFVGHNQKITNCYQTKPNQIGIPLKLFCVHQRENYRMMTVGSFVW